MPKRVLWFDFVTAIQECASGGHEYACECVPTNSMCVRRPYTWILTS